MKNKTLKKALLKQAAGYEAVDEVLEYVVEDGALTLAKKKITKKQVEPNLSAIKTLLELEGNTGELNHLTDEELLAERKRLINELNVNG